MTAEKRGNARVCGDCWYLLRPDQYEPFTFNWTDEPCSLCGHGGGALHRVSWTEVDEYRAANPKEA
jgi:hypothetical protein